MKNKVVDPKDELERILATKVKKLGYSEDVNLAYDRTLAHGDLVTPVALNLAARAKKKPMQVAEELIDGLSLHSSIDSVNIARPGFINFTLAQEYLGNIATNSITLPLKDAKHSKIRVVVEYSSPNIAKPFSVGHLRSTIIGDAVANLYAALGYNVTRVNHLGDWGTQFGKLIYAYKTWGDDKKLEADPIGEMLALYVKFHTEAEIDTTIENHARRWFKKLADGDDEAKDLWRKFVRWSMVEFRRVYNLLGVKFDKEMGESFYGPLLADVIASIKKQGLARVSDGALVIKFPRAEMPLALLQKNDGTSLYMTRDLAALKYRLQKMKADTVIYHTGDEQTLHFKQLFKIAELMGWDKGKTLVHAAHGLMRLPEGKMSTRRGRVIKLDDLLSEAVRRAYSVVNKKNPKLSQKQKQAIAQTVGIAAVKYNDLANHRRTAVVFNWNKMLSLEGNSAPYLLYAYARLHSIQSKTQVVPKLGAMNEDEQKLIRRSAQFADVIEEAANTQAPNILAHYLFELANAYSSYYEKYPVLKADSTTRQHRLAIIRAGADTLKSGLALLGISVLDKI